MNPFKTRQQLAQKNMLAGYVEPSHFNDFQFENQRRTFHSYGELFWLVSLFPVWFAVSLPVWFIVSFPFWLVGSFPVHHLAQITWLTQTPLQLTIVWREPGNERALKTWRGSVNVVDDSCVAQFSLVSLYIWYLNWAF